MLSDAQKLQHLFRIETIQHYPSSGKTDKQECDKTAAI